MWLERQTEAAQTWIRYTSNPLLVSAADGGILWANEAFENLLGYTSAELKGMSWKKITVDSEELESDESMMHEVLRGDRRDYTLVKSYRHRKRHPVECIIHVLRYPLVGPEVSFFLVSVHPVDQHRDCIRQTETLRMMMSEVIALLNNRKTAGAALAEWSRANPRLTILMGAVLCVLLFGSRVIEIARDLVGIISPKP